ncbi:MAG: GNAT family N-acetyltransferase [Caulobacteraceae bacterium]
MEEAELNAFPPLREAILGGWTLRFSEGAPRRAASSASPLSATCRADEGFLDCAEALYRRRGSTPLFRVPTLMPDGIDTRLEARGYTAEGESCVIFAPLHTLPQQKDAAVRLSPSPSSRWRDAMAAFQGYGRSEARLYQRMLRSIAGPCAFAMLSLDGKAAAMAYGSVHDGVLVYESVVTDPARRRQGLARRVLAHLAAWGARNGAEIASLQVQADNAPARALYHAFGLTQEASRYHYRRAPVASG